jgi:WD40 repeat protein
MTRISVVGFLMASAHLAAQPYGYLSSVPAQNYIQAMPANGTKAVNIPLAGLPANNGGTPLVVNSAGTIAYTLYGGFSPSTSLPSGGIVATSLTSGATLANIPCPLWLTGLILSPDGQTLYAFGESATGYDLLVLSTGSLQIAQTVSLPSPPFDPGSSYGAMAISNDGTTLYISWGIVYVVDTSTFQANTIMAPDQSTDGIALSPDGSQLWASIDNNSISVYDTATLALITSIAGAGGNDLLFTPDGSAVIAVGNSMQRINASAFQIEATLATPGAFASPGPNANSFLVASGNHTTLLVSYQTLSVVRSIPQLGYVSGTAALAASGTLLSVNTGMSAIQVFDPASLSIVGQIPIGYAGEAPVVNGSGTIVYVPDDYGNRLMRIDAVHRVVTGWTGGLPSAFTAVLSPDGATAYTMNNNIIGEAKDFVSVIDTATDTITKELTSNGISSLTLAQDGSSIYMTVSTSYFQHPKNPDCPLGGGMCVFDSTTFALLAQLDVSGSLSASQNGQYVYAIGGTEISLVDTATLQVMGTINLPSGVTGGSMLVNPQGHSALVFGYDSTSESVVAYLFDTSTNQIGQPFPIPPNAFSEAFTPDGASIWFVCLNQTLPNLLIGESFPSGNVIGQLETDASWIAFQP